MIFCIQSYEGSWLWGSRVDAPAILGIQDKGFNDFGDLGLGL